MKVAGVVVFIVVSFIMGMMLGALRGRDAEDDRIVATCKDADSVTEIRGETYLCLTSEAAQAIAKRLQQRGA